jgi:hypothetical protein
MSVQHYLRFAGIGWISGIGWILLLAFVIMPNVFGSSASLATPADQIVLGLALLIITPEAMLGGVIGGRIMREGGATSQAVMAAVIGALLTLPVGCISLWYLGW